MSHSTSYLIVLTGSMGDCIKCAHALTFFNLQNQKIWWLINEKWIELSMLTDNIKFITVKNNIFSYIKELLRTQKFEVIIDLQRILKSGIISFLKGKTRIGFHKQDSKEFNYIFNNTFVTPWSKSETKLDKYIQMFKLAGLKLNNQIKTEKIEFKTSQAAVILGGSWASKKLSPQSLNYLMGFCFKSGAESVFLLGGLDCINLANFISKKDYPTKKVINLVGIPLKETINFVRNFDGFGVGGDTGLAHLFAFFHKPYFTIFGPSCPNKNTPYGLRDYIVTPNLTCSPCEKKKCFFGTNFCLTQASKKLLEKSLNC